MNVTLRNLGKANRHMLVIENKTDSIRIFFSYETPVAFEKSNEGIVVRENEWSTTTGRFLNELEPDKTKRVSGEKFKALLDQI